MPSSNNSEVNGCSRAGPQNQQSTFASQASTVAQQDNRHETIPDDTGLEENPTASGEGPLNVQDSRQNVNPMEDLLPKDWEELEMRYEREMEAAVQHEQSIMDEIEWIMKVCGC